MLRLAGYWGPEVGKGNAELGNESRGGRKRKTVKVWGKKIQKSSVSGTATRSGTRK